jgi:D-arabinose 1-dehydrogenase-like Zn-dependent alcohol dehydrogenase
MRTISSIFILLTISLGLFAQDFSVPKDYKLVKAEDYAPYEQDIINCVDWLVKTPLKDQPEKRKEANAFLLKWLTGSPNVHIEIKQEIVTFIGTSPDLLMIFMGGWAKYSLESKDFDNKKKGSKAGIDAVIDFYSANRDFLPKDKNVEKYIKMKKKGKLADYIEKNA